MRAGTRGVFLVVLGATLLLQAAWSLALPAFRGIDEFDHVYKAHSVAHGHLRDQGLASRHGSVIVVPEGVVEAASPVCASYWYTGPDNCHPIERLGDGMVTVGSGAGSYNPTYYAAVGWVTRLFDPVASVFALRALTGLLAALLLAWAACVTAAWSRTAWPMLTLLVAATPVLVYSSAVASPNGITYAASCLLWAAGLTLVEGRRPRFVPLAVAGVTVVVTHSTGLMWLACVTLIIALLASRTHWRRHWQAFRRPATRTCAVVAAAGLATLLWILTARTNSLPPTKSGIDFALSDLFVQQSAWVFQTIAAFPLRNEAAPVAVYALWGLPLLTVLVLGARTAQTRLRLALGLLLVMWTVIPVALTVVSYSSIGFAWQGRYALPLAVGFMALAGLALDRGVATPAPLITRAILMTCALAQVISCVAVARKESTAALTPVFTTAVPGGILVVAVLATLGALLPFLLLRERAEAQPEPQRDEVSA